MASCASDDNKSDDTTSSAASTATAPSSNTAAVEKPKKGALTGSLDYLWVTMKKFEDSVDNGKKLVLSFTFRDPDILTLYGWSCKNNNCTDNFGAGYDHDITFEKGRPSGQNYGPNIIFGNVVIFRKFIETIKNKRDPQGNKYAYVVFEPHPYLDYINYKVYVTNDDPRPGAFNSGFTLEDTGVETNPSPPKNNSN